jgi:hypothetical protein
MTSRREAGQKVLLNTKTQRHKGSQEMTRAFIIAADLR